MWLAKLVIPANEGMLLASRTKKYNVTLMGYPLSHFWKNKRFYLLASVYLVGDDKDKKAFLRDLKKDKRAVKIDMMSEDFGFWLMEQHPSIKIIYDPLIIHAKPLIVSSAGENVFEIASWHKEKLMAVARLIRTKLYGGKVAFLKRTKINSVAMVSLMPKLTKKQKRAFELAIEHGYYGYPRKIEGQELAKIMKVSTSTYQFHLRTAEKKTIPYLYNKLIS